MNKVVLALMSLFFCNTLFANVPEEKPLSHYLAIATANTINRLKTVDGYTQWIALKLPPNHVKDVQSYFKKHGLKPSDKIPRAMSDGNKVCLDKTDCFTYSDTTVSYNGVAFRVEDKPFPKVLSDVCAKIGCSSATAQMDFIPKAHARNRSPWIGALLGAAVGWFAADQLGGSSTRGAIAGALIGGLATHYAGSENRHACSGNCSVACSGGQYGIQPYQPVTPPGYLNQPNTPYYVPPAFYNTAYGQSPQPCSAGSAGATDLQIALNTPPQPTYCTSQCVAPQPYSPIVNPGAPGPQYQPAVVSEKAKKESGRKAASEPKK